MDDSGTATITAANDLRIRIPASFPATWDAADVTPTLGGTAASKVAAAVTYEDSDRTLVLDVTADFSAGEDLTIADLSFAAFSATAPPAQLELEVANDGLVTAVDDKTIRTGAPTIESATFQNFIVGGQATPNRPLTITDDATVATITAGQDLRIRIPAAISMTWFTTDSTAVLAGSAAAKVSSIVHYDDPKTAVFDVTSDFAAGDDLEIQGIRFANFTAVSPVNHLTLDVSNNGGTTATDPGDLHILAAQSTRSSALAITPNGEELWSVNPDHGTVSVIKVQTPNDNTLLAEIPIAREPWCLAIHPTNGEVWVTSERDDHVYIVDAATRAVVDSLPAGFETFGVAFDPSGMSAFVTASGSDQLFVFDVPTRTVTNTLSLYRRPRGIAVRGDAERVWITHLLNPEFFGRVTTYFPSTSTKSEILINQVFGTDIAGYPSTVQNPIIAPPPYDGLLWLPNNTINTTRGNLSGGSLTPQNIVHATIRPISTVTSQDLRDNTYFLSEGGSPATGYPGGTPVGGPIAVDFKASRAYVANLHSDNVMVIDDDLLNPLEIAIIPAGKAPIGIVAHPSRSRVYVSNWLSRDITVINPLTNTVVTTVAATTFDPLATAVLHGKQLFFTSKGDMSLDERGSCASCHVWGKADGRPWDLSQFGKHLRATPDMRGIAFTGAHDWTGDKDEMQDHNFGIIEFMGGPGLIPGGGNPPLGAPNAGLSQDLDDMAAYMNTVLHRPDTPFLMPDGSLTPDAQAGEILFNDPVVGCATCHVPPFFTDSTLDMPFVKHDVGTIDPADTDAAAGFDTPSLIGVWDTGPYLHHHFATTLTQVFTSFNPSDQHGTTSHLNSTEISQLVAYVKSIAWPDSVGLPVGVPEFAEGPDGSFDNVFPNPFASNTSMRFSLERPAAEVRLEIFDVTGRRVRHLISRPFTRGSHLVGWDSRNDDGRRVAAGVYWARLAVDGENRGEKKMVILR
ncbi:MAG: hypothetical protein KC591_10665 [Gemmatimonadetes bacterium]|nr:hypothetical protein [Gemmatimonadota bacterium]